MMHSASEILQRALANFAKHGPDSSISSNRDQVINAAREGRVADLCFSDGAKSPGAGEDRCMAFVLDQKEMPVAGDVAAVLRH